MTIMRETSQIRNLDKHAVESNFCYKEKIEAVAKAVPNFEVQSNKSFKIPKNLTNNISRKAGFQLPLANNQCKNRNSQPFERSEDVLILDFEGESEIDVESVKDWACDENMESDYRQITSKSMNARSAFENYWFQRFSNYDPQSETFIPSFETIIKDKKKLSDSLETIKNEDELPWSGEKFSTDESDSDDEDECSFKRRRIDNQCADQIIQESDPYYNLEGGSSDDTLLLQHSINPKESNKDLSSDFEKGFSCDKPSNLTAVNLDKHGQSQVNLDSDISISHVLDAIKANCKNNEINEALSIAQNYISISPDIDAKKAIFKVLLINVMEYVKFQVKYRENEPIQNVFCAICDLIFDYNLFDSEICSLIIIECIGLEITYLFAENIFIFCKKQSIPLSRDAMSTYSNALDSKEVPIFQFLSFFEYVKEVCGYPLPKNLFCKILELFTKREKHFQISVSEEFKKVSSLLCTVGSSEVDCSVLQKFLECCIKHEHWNIIADFFRAWFKKSILCQCLYQSLAFPLEDCGSSYEKFAAAVHDNVGNDLPMHHASLFGQIGSLLMMETFTSGHQRSALKILLILHKYKINYFELQTPVYYMDSVETCIKKIDDPLEVYVFPYTVAFTAVDICLYYRRPKDAFEIFQSFSFFTPSEITNSKLKSYVTVRRFIYLLKLSQLFMCTEPLNRGMEVMRLLLNAAENDFSLEDLVDFSKELETVYNQYLVFILNRQQIKTVSELYKHSEGPLKDIFSIHPEVLRGLVVFFAQNDLEEVAKKLFHAGYLRNIYHIEKPDVEDMSWCLTVVSSWTKKEIKLAIEFYIEMLFPVLFLRHSKSDEEWFPVQIKFQEDPEYSPSIFCLDEHSTHIEAAIKKTCGVLQSLDSEIVWLENAEKNCLIIQAELFYNYWKRTRTQEESSPRYLKLPVINIKEKTTENSQLAKLPQTSYLNKSSEVGALGSSTEKSSSNDEKTSPRKDILISPKNVAKKRSLSSEGLREHSLSSTSPSPKNSRYSSPCKAISPKVLPFSINDVKTVNKNQQRPIPSIENKKVTTDTQNASLDNRNSDMVLTPCSGSDTYSLPPTETANAALTQLKNDNLSSKNIPYQQMVKELAQGTVAPQTTFDSTPKLLKSVKTPKCKKIKSAPNKKLKSTTKVVKKSVTFKRENGISKLNLNKKPKLLMNEKISIVFDGTRNISVTPKQPPNTSVAIEKTIGNAVTSKQPSSISVESQKSAVASKQPSNISIVSQKSIIASKKPSNISIVSQKSIIASKKPSNISIVSQKSIGNTVPSKQPSNSSIISLKSIGSVKPSQTSNFHVSNQEEFEKITHFLKTKILQKCKNLNPEDSHQKAMDLARNFMKENNVLHKLDKKGMKLLFEFSDKNI